MTVTLLTLDGSLWECEAKYDPGVIVFNDRAFVRRGFNLVYKEQDTETVYQISKKEIGE